MPLNLISDAWIPVLTTEGLRTIAPWQMADPAIIRPSWPRPDLNLAFLEFLIGLVFLADPPAHDEEWGERQAPDPDRLRTRLEPFAPAFNVTGDAPLFMQDLEALEGKPNPPDMLFIDSAGANTAKNNADLMVRRGRYPALDPALAAMALYTFQAFAPSGGAGNRTSMRGGGPMVTLVDPGQGLWPLIWANVPYGRPATPDVLPWMRQTVTSEKDAKVWPAEAHPAEALFGMPRRLRLIEDDEGITGVVQRPYGTNYAGWVHSLSPYYRMKEGSELLPQHPRAGLFGYRNWLGIVAEQPGQDLRHRAFAVNDWRNRGGGAASVIVAGWAMDNMKPLDFIWSEQPLIDLPEDRALCLVGLVTAADFYAQALRGALRPVLAEGSAREAVREAFYTETQGPFEARVAELTAVNPLENVARDWVADMRGVAMRLFEARALPGLADRDIKAQGEIVSQHRFLGAAFAGYGALGKKAYGALDLPIPAKPKKKEAAA